MIISDGSGACVQHPLLRLILVIGEEKNLVLQIAVALEACVQAYVAGNRMADLEKIIEGSEPEDAVYEGYKTVILAKASEDVLVSFFLYCICKDSFIA